MNNNMVWVYIGEADENVTDAARAGELIAELMGSPRKFEDAGEPGLWLVEFTETEMDEFRTNRWFGRENDDRVLETE